VPAGLVIALAVSVAPAVGQQSSPPVPDLNGVTLTLWTSTGIAQPVMNVWTRFGEASGARIEYIAIPDPFEDSLMAKWVAGDRPDILGFHPGSLWLQRLQADQNLVDLSDEDFVDRTLFDLHRYTGTLDGTVYAAFTTFPGVFGVFYNTAVFERLGLQPPEDWQGLVALCQTIRAADPSVTPIVAGAGAMWPLQGIAAAYLADEVAAGIEDEINAGNVTFTDPRITAAHEALLEMRDQGCFEDDLATSQYEDQVARLYEGEGAMVFMGTFILDDLNASYGADEVAQRIGYFPISGRDRLAFWTIGQTGTYEVPINADPVKQAGALAFVRYATGEGYQAYLDESGDLPVLEGFEPPAGVSPVRRQLYDHLLGGAVQFFGSTLKYPKGDWHVYLNELLVGAKSAEEVGQAMQEAWDTAAAAAEG
jgi:raffinose/stachyose/melibiose transport system substrate-binding protein